MVFGKNSQIGYAAKKMFFTFHIMLWKVLTSKPEDWTYMSKSIQEFTLDHWICGAIINNSSHLSSKKISSPPFED